MEKITLDQRNAMLKTPLHIMFTLKSLDGVKPSEASVQTIQHVLSLNRQYVSYLESLLPLANRKLSRFFINREIRKVKKTIKELESIPHIAAIGFIPKGK